MVRALETFGKYLLLERLAAGGMAEVYLSKSFGAGGIGKFVAMKRILPQFTDNQEFIDMFKEEAKIVMNLNHANIVTIFDFGIEKDQFFLVMEFVEGQNLRQILNHLKKIAKYLTIDQIIYIAKEVASGLDHAHRCIDASTGRQLNITHRDMSPQNIMISFEGEVKIVDFGIAKAETQLEQTRAGTIKGKFGYMSPEQVEGIPVDSRTDIFSLGIVLWELLAQDRLFTAQNEAATLRKIRECQIPAIRKLNPEVHPDLERIVNKALTRDKNLRYQTAETFSRDLSIFLNTNYPEFSKQEFSKFMKTIYSDMYIENRKKLADYAKIEIEDKAQNQNDSNSETKTEAHTQEDESQSTTNFAAKRNKRKPEDSFPFDVLSKKDIRANTVDISKLRNEKSETEASESNTNSSNQNKKIALTSSFEQTVEYGLFEKKPDHSNASINIKPIPNSSKTNPSTISSIGGWLITLSLFGVFGYSAFLFSQDPKFAHQIRELMKQYIPREPAQVQQPTPIQKQVPVNIQSSPAGAMVYIDDKPIGMTPLIHHIDSGKAFKLRLIKDGFLPYDLPLEKANDGGYNKSLTLMPEPAAGLVTIEASNGGEKPIIFVNGQRFDEVLPFTTKIPAGTPIMIKVINPFTKLEGTQTVVIGQGQRKSVKIFLDRQAQQ